MPPTQGGGFAAGRWHPRAAAVAVALAWLLWNNLHVVAPALRCAVSTSTSPVQAGAPSSPRTNATSSPKGPAAPHPAPLNWSRLYQGNNASRASANEGNPFDRCYYVWDICHASHRWFYRSTGGAGSRRQPRLIFQTDSHVSPPHGETVYRKFYTVDRATEATKASSAGAEQCSTSPVPNHLVLYSPYNDMLGEFYDRSLVFLYRLSVEAPWVSSDQTQLYVHLHDTYRGLLDSHHLFTSPFRVHPLLDFVTLLDEPRCTCLERLIFCGYSHHRIDGVTKDALLASSSPAGGKLPRVDGTDKEEEDLDGDDESDEKASSWVWLRPGGAQMGYGDRRPVGNTVWYRRIRDHLRRFLLDDRSAIARDARAYRDRILQQRGVPVDRRDRCLFVGLTQREGRRRWRDLSTTLEEAERLLRPDGFEIVLVEMNLEVDSSAYQQVVRHAALDGLIGIHGAQLTEAIWMKPGSWVVELLPYGHPDIKGGRWTRQTSSPTPLGRIFDNTDLNHAGYPLQRHNSPYCLDRPESDLDCWRNVKWSARDFTMDGATLEAILRHTVLAQSPERQHPQLLCHEYRQHADPRFLVLYNVNCADEPGQPAVPHHYYWNASRDAA